MLTFLAYIIRFVIYAWHCQFHPKNALLLTSSLSVNRIHVTTNDGLLKIVWMKILLFHAGKELHVILVPFEGIHSLQKRTGQ